jgi:hypothetical protein
MEVSPEKLAASAPAIAQFEKAGFKITRVRGGSAVPRGISMEQWRMREITRQCDEYLKSLPPKPVLTSKPKRGKPPKGIHRRERGQTAVYGGWEWIYSRHGLTDASWRQIRELTAQGERIQVVQWPQGAIVFDSANDDPFPENRTDRAGDGSPIKRPRLPAGRQILAWTVGRFPRSRHSPSRSLDSLACSGIGLRSQAMVKIPPGSSASTSINTAQVRSGARRRAAAPIRPYYGPTRAALSAAEVLMDDVFAPAGVPRSADFVEQLAVIVDCHARLPELIEALASAHALCTGLLAADQLPAAELGVPAERCAEIERARVRVRSALAQVAAKSEEALRLAGEMPAPAAEGEVVFADGERKDGAADD